MSLSKIPVIVILTLGFKAMLTPPQPPPAKNEIVSSTKIDSTKMRYYRLTLGHIVQAVAAVVEIAAIFAVNYPSFSVSQRILSFCTFDGQPNKLRLGQLGSLGAIFWAVGAALRIRTYKDLGRFFRYDISIQKDHRLITNGLYSYVRHPAYSGMLLANIGWFLWNGGEGSWVRESGILKTTLGQVMLLAYAIFVVVPTSAITLSRMSKEDEALRQTFGDEWDKWAAKVPYSVLPGIY
ncbi:hypothetical protein GALMADRAFT_95964 [Galerina marginata CBS 339.88]|uniref:Protein-S-isoprenylcysteine O-methyltransferase n=1 Tax=Galerina marginata (strain CBS 339.88) TaxID=685588 RepID=A0A067T4F9_GALM3|nr:hypothetical protein GALMADRAFT_95964 [Galerina marginata CBS 339.88]